MKKSEIVYLDKDNNVVSEKQATHAVIRSQEDGKLVETWVKLRAD